MKAVQISDWRLEHRGPILNMRRQSEKPQAQETLALDLLRFIEERMSGRAESEIVGSLSYNRFAIGALASRVPETIENHRDALRRPRSNGTRFLLPKAAIAAATLDIEFDFCVFYPVYPKWDAVRHLMERGAADEKTVDLKPAERKVPLRFQVSGVALADVWGEATHTKSWRIKTLDEAIQTAGSDPRTLRIDPDDGKTRYFKRVRRFLDNRIFDEGDQNGFYEAWVASQPGAPIVPAWKAQAEVSLVEQGDNIEVSIVFTNESEQEEGATESKAFLHDCRFSIRVHGAHFVQQRLQGSRGDDYRLNPVEEATGIHCCVRSEGGQLVYNLPIPTFVLPHTEPNAEFERFCKFETLASDACVTNLEAIRAGMAQYMKDWRKERSVLLGLRVGHKPSEESFDAAVAGFEAEISRYDRGLEALKTDANALRAFKLLNEAMDRANSPRYAKNGKDGFAGWRTFQLVFLVSTLKDVVVREHPEWPREMDGRDHVDVVWVATGGGKTETYLGLIGFTLLFDRLRGKHRGLSAWVKFPLRMLSLDQLDRFAKLVLVLQVVAKEGQIPGDPFCIGYYMGDANTPNSFSVSEEFQRYGKSPAKVGAELQKLKKKMPTASNAEISAKLFDDVLAETDAKRYRLMTNCPARDCGEVVHVWIDLDKERSTIVCPTHGELPILFVDDEIYRTVPSIIISTIDKLAILAFNAEVRNIIVRPYGQCPKHGYYATPSVAKDSCKPCRYSNGTPPVFRKVMPEEFYDPTPALQVQDELHLLKEQLGSYDSHYEGLIDYLHGTLLPSDPTFRVHAARGRTKIVGATATISEYEHQVSQLYGRAEPRRFPVLGKRTTDSFYMSAMPEARRVLATLWAVNMTMPVVHDEVLVAYWARLLSFQKDLTHFRQVLTEAGVDQAKLSDDDLRDVLDLSSTSLSYFQNKQKAFQRIQDLRSYFPKLAREYFPELVPGFDATAGAMDTLTGDNNFQEIRQTKTRLETRFGRPQWLAHLGATSIISHGVDVSRLNFILFSGQPTETAEYIQASSRVGRRHVGVSIVLGDTLRDRDELHFINHIMYHRYQDSFVSGASISRYSRHLIRRTFPGLFLALLQLYWNPTQPGSAYKFKANDAEQVVAALGSGAVRAKIEHALVMFLQRSTPDPELVKGLVQDAWSDMHREGVQNSSKGKSFAERLPHFRPLTNHREIEEAFQIGPAGEDGQFLRGSQSRSGVWDAPDEADAERPNYMTDMGEAS